MTEYSPGEDLVQRGGIGGQDQRPGGNASNRPSQYQGERRRGDNRSRDRISGGQNQSRDLRLPEGYLQHGYFDGQGNIHERLIVSDAFDLARKLEEGGMTRNQLRNFYSEAANIKRLLGLRKESFDSLKGRISKLAAFAHSAANRSTNRVPPLFYQFIQKNVEFATQSQKNFQDGFCEHFECVVLYFRGR